MKLVKKPIQFAVVIVVVVGALWYLNSQTPEASTDDVQVVDLSGPDSDSGSARVELKAKKFEKAKEITTPDHFINTDEFKLQDLIGEKVILIDFWTYSCINCRRTTPYLNAWYEKYADKGLVIVGIHTPEFDFEKVAENVESAVDDLGIKFPVVMDNDFSTWRAYKNRFWPRKYLIDIDGFIVYDHIGEGAYDETEAKIQELLKERSDVLGMKEELPDDMVTVAADAPSPGQSPEVYFGSDRNELLANGSPSTAGTQDLKISGNLGLNKLYLGGKWKFAPEFAELMSDGGKVAFKFKAKKVYFVGSSEKPVRVKVSVDGKPVDNFAGKDVDEDGYITVNAEKLYNAFSADSFGEHEIELEAEGAGLKMFTFTFG